MAAQETKSFGVLIPINLARNIEFLMRIEGISFEDAVIAGLQLWQEKVIASEGFTEKAEKELDKVRHTVEELKKIEEHIKPDDRKN